VFLPTLVGLMASFNNILVLKWTLHFIKSYVSLWDIKML
jgi:hypothetical protein